MRKKAIRENTRALERLTEAVREENALAEQALRVGKQQLANSAGFARRMPDSGASSRTLRY